MIAADGGRDADAGDALAARLDVERGDGAPAVATVTACGPPDTASSDGVRLSMRTVPSPATSREATVARSDGQSTRVSTRGSAGRTITGRATVSGAAAAP